MNTGYLNPLYTKSFSDYGSPLYLEKCGGWVLKRNIPGFSYNDAMWTYPIFTCLNWGKLPEDMNQLADTLVSISAVTDPFGNYSYEDLQEAFPDVCYPFKDHFIVDLGRSPESFVNPHHRRNVNHAVRNVKVLISEDPSEWLDEWDSLYNLLVIRHKIKGITRFSKKIFETQLSVPGIIAFKAFFDRECVGMLLWYTQNSIAYYHLGAYTDLGYKQKASFALFWNAIEYFADHSLKWMSLGAGAGLQRNNNDGLTRFKSGWATGVRTAYFCGRIFDHGKYSEISSSKNNAAVDFFPAYRFGEFF